MSNSRAWRVASNGTIHRKAHLSKAEATSWAIENTFGRFHVFQMEARDGETTARQVYGTRWSTNVRTNDAYRNVDTLSVRITIPTKKGE